MKKIAIFASGEAKNSTVTARTFMCDNRARVILAFTDSAADSATAEGLRRAGAETVCVESLDDIHGHQTIAVLMEKGVDLILTENLSRELPPELTNAYAGRIIAIEGNTDECLDAIVARISPEENHAASSRTVPPPVPNGAGVDEEWARRLHINFDTSKASVPPPVPVCGDTAAPYPNSGVHVPKPTEPMPPTFLVLSIICTLLCCFIPGIVAIIFSSMVSSRYYAGDIEGAKRASRTAEIWIIVSFVLGVLSATLYIPLMMAV